MRGVVLEGKGNGRLHHELEAEELRAKDEGMDVLHTTRCGDEHILPKACDALRDAGGLSPVKARISLMLELLRAAG